MSETHDEARGWIEATRAALDEGEPHDDRLLGLVRDVDARYQANAGVAEDEQVPLEVFEALIERIQGILARSTTERVYAALQALPAETFGRSELIKAARARRLAVLDEAVSAHADDVEALHVRGLLRLDDRDDEGAAADFAAALRLDGKHRGARRGAIRVALREERYADALVSLDELLRQEPRDGFGLMERARLRLRYHHVPEALADLEVLAASEAPRDALVFAARQLVTYGKPHAALGAAARLDDDLEAMVVAGKAQLALGDPGKAASTLERALHLRGVDQPLERLVSARITALDLLAEARLRVSDTAQALERTLEAMALVGTTYGLRRRLASIAWQAHAERSPAVIEGEDDAALARRWIEPNMEAEFADGRPTVIRIHELGSIPLLERLPWCDEVAHLLVAPGARDERDAFEALFGLRLPRLRHLEIHAEHFGWSCVRRLVEAPFFAALEGVTLVNCDLDAPSLQLLLDRLPRGLRALRLVGADARPRLPRATSVATSLRALAQAELVTLSLADCGLGPADVEALLAATLPALVALDLTGNDLSGLAAGSFLASPLVRRLRLVRLVDTGASDEVLAGLGDRSTR